MTFTDNVIKDALLTLEHFLQKVAALDIFEALIFNYKIKVGLLDSLSVNILSIVSEFSNELQVLSKDNSVVKNEPSAILPHPNMTPASGIAKSTEPCQEIPLVLSFCDGEVNNKPLELVEIPVSSELEGQRTNSEDDKKDGDIIFECSLEEALKWKNVLKKEEDYDALEEHDEAKEACNFISAQNDDVTEDGDFTKADHGKRMEEGNENRDIKSTTCNFCYKKFLSSSRLEGHLSKCPKARAKHKSRGQSYRCKICDKTFASLKPLQKHVSEVHSLTDDSCPVAEKSPLYRVVEVQSLPVNLPFYCCKTCLSVYKTPIDFETHPCKEIAEMLDSEGYGGDYFHLLGKYLVSNPDVLASMKKFRCGTCREEYRSMNRMLYHLHRCSQGPYPCELCSTEFTTKRELNRHKKKTHRDANSFFCDECGLAFKLRTSLQKHKVNRHETRLETTCAQCNLTFAKRVQLTNHMIREHRVERKFLCQVCGNKFSTHGSLMVHLTTHSEPCKFTCTFCNKKFRQKEKLKFHIRIHTGERPHLCSTCGKGFIRKSKLDEHMRRHRGEKQHHCFTCGKSYASSWDLKLHLRKQHNVEGNTTARPSNEAHQQQLEGAVGGEPPQEDPDDPDDPDEVAGAEHSPTAQTTVAIMPSEEPTDVLLHELPEEAALTQLAELPMAQPTAVSTAAVTAAPEGKLLLQLEPAQLPGTLLQTTAGDAAGSRLLVQLGQGGDASSRILVQLDPSHTASAGSQPLVPQSTILTVTDALQLAPMVEELNLNLGGIPTQFIQLQGASAAAPGQGPADATGAAATLPMHIQLPVSAVQVPSISQPPSGTQQYSLQPMPVHAVFTPSGFNVNSISY